MRIVDNLPTVLVRINRRGPFRMAVDTGQPFSLSVAPDQVRAMRLRLSGRVSMGDPSNVSSLSVPTYRADSVVIGGLTFSHVDVVGSPRLHRNRTVIAGTIGIGLFSDMTLTLDYGRSRLDAVSVALPPPDGREILDARVDARGLISVPITIGGALRYVHLDTGNGRFGLFMPTDQVADIPTRGAVRDIGTARTVTHQIRLNAVDLAVPVRAGTTLLPVDAVAYPSVASTGNLGSPALAGMLLSVDVRNHRVRIARSNR
ncbi:hypothetical protein EAH79_11535 [Sphingomonas koreensis]|nr:hypothetical protein EAH79_11535 [Sphingomonas koreensis]